MVLTFEFMIKFYHLYKLQQLQLVTCHPWFKLLSIYHCIIVTYTAHSKLFAYAAPILL